MCEQEVGKQTRDSDTPRTCTCGAIANSKTKVRKSTEGCWNTECEIHVQVALREAVTSAERQSQPKAALQVS